MTQDKIPSVTIAIPTYNRSQLLKKSLQSVLTQTHADLEVLILDNASEADTQSVVQAMADPRVRYVGSNENIGLFRNWNRAIKLNRSPYLAILPDDDELLPEFIQQSLAALEANPNAAYSFAKVNAIGMDNEPVPLSDECPDDGVMSGLELLHQFVAGTNWVIQPSTVMIRTSALDAVGPFDTTHSRLSIDLNLYLRLAAAFDIVFIAKVLARNRIHAEQQTQQSHRSSGGTGPLATLAERTDAVAHLLKSERGESASYRLWLADRLMQLSLRRSEMTSDFIPDINLSWQEKLEVLKEEIEAIIPPGDKFVFIDDDMFSDNPVSGRHAIPLLQRDGQSLGAPHDSAMAIRELEQLHRSGINYVLIAWPAFWWLDYYIELREYLTSSSRCVLNNSRLLAFKLDL
ncbi:MAG: glycosyltransferase family 2 protein [Gammaproteobacteria bacterium]|nr:MAG: glycosyltransferase family 2 protein [Gammaproteobacteria bacterium]